jgi:hypothetical protein
LLIECWLSRNFLFYYKEGISPRGKEN